MFANHTVLVIRQYSLLRGHHFASYISSYAIKEYLQMLVVTLLQYEKL